MGAVTMNEKGRLAGKIKNLALQEICCASPALYGIFQQVQENAREMFGYLPAAVLKLYMEGGMQAVSRLLLHSLFHVLYLHPAGKREDVQTELWNLACDITVEYTLDCLKLWQVTGRMGTEAFKRCRLLWKEARSLSTEEVYEELQKLQLDTETRKAWAKLFERDDHCCWKKADKMNLDSLLKGIRGLSLNSGSSINPGRAGTEKGVQTEWYQLQEKRRRDYYQFLKKFTIEREEMQLDTESFDYIPYLYGLMQYKNLPIIEPLEYTETKKLQELVIAIDTSSSCTRETVQNFLEEVYAVLSRQEDFFRKMNVHIIQCDCYVQEDWKVTCEREWKEYLKQIKIQGRGGTDFRPVFRYVEKLRKEGELSDLKGLLYFTDGDGIYPTEKTDY